MTSDTLLRQQLDEALNGLQFSVDNISEGDTFNFKTISPAMNSYLIDKLMALVSKAVEEARLEEVSQAQLAVMNNRLEYYLTNRRTELTANATSQEKNGASE